MVAQPRTAGGDDLRPVNAPRAIRVRADSRGRPRAVQRVGGLAPRAVARVQDRWRVDDEWWRGESIARDYMTVLLDDGRALTLYHDLNDDAWYEQRG
jgi:hypothetical protein